MISQDNLDNVGGIEKRTLSLCKYMARVVIREEERKGKGKGKGQKVAKTKRTARQVGVSKEIQLRTSRASKAKPKRVRWTHNRTLATYTDASDLERALYPRKINKSCVFRRDA